MGEGAVLAVVAALLTVPAAALWATPSPEPPGAASFHQGIRDASAGGSPVGAAGTRSSNDPAPQAFTIVPPDQMSYRLLDYRDVLFPLDYAPAIGPSLILTDYPWGRSSSFTPGLTSPLETRLTVYNYTTDAFRSYNYNVSFGGGFTFPGEITAVSAPNGTYLFTASSWGGDGGSYPYTGVNLSWPFSSVIDVPRPSGMASLNFHIPITGRGYSPSELLYVERAWSRSGYELIGHVSVSRYMGNPPAMSFLYFVNLSSPEFLDVTRAHDVAPSMEIPWDATLGWGFFERATPNVLFNVRLHYIGDTYYFEYVFYDVSNSTGMTFTAPSVDVEWHERRGDLLYLLMDMTSSPRPFERTYVFVQVDLARARDFGTLAADAITELWRKTFWQNYTNYYPIPIVQDDSFTVLEGSYGNEPEWGPRFDSVTTYGLLNGSMRSVEVLSLQQPRLRLHDITYPRPPARAVYGSYLLDLGSNTVDALNFTDVETFIDQRTGRHTSCSYCRYDFYVTDYTPSKVLLFGLAFTYTTPIRASFASVEINIGNPPPNEPPTAAFAYTPTAYVDTMIAFDGSRSDDVDGVIQSYTWDFGDGTTGVGDHVYHRYTSTGPRTVTLTVASNGGLRGTTSAVVTVHTLVPHDNRAGFRLPVPEDWDLQTDLPGAAVQLDGPTYNGTGASILVASHDDPGATEDVSYLVAQAATLLAEIRADHPDMSVVGGPSYQRIAGHMADVFLVRYDSDTTMEKIAIVASAEHEHRWVLRFAINIELFGWMDAVFDRMLAGFEITLVPFAETFTIAVGILGACGFGALIPALLITLWPRRKVRAGSQAPGRPAGRGRASSCPACGAPAVDDARFCWKCGATLAAAPSEPTASRSPPHL